METKLPVLEVCMFGKAKITYGDISVLTGRGSITKVMKLLLILIYRGKKGITRNKLFEDLYEREDLANVANNLRVTMHRLKKMLIEAGLPEYEYIVSKDGSYYWDSPVEVRVDTARFEELIEKAEASQERQSKIELLKEACALYKGEFLQKLSGDVWVLLESMRYKELYDKALNALCSCLKEERDYEECLKQVGPACEMYPFDEWQSVKIDCYIAMNRYKDALKEYKATARLLFEELGVKPSEQMEAQFEALSKHITNRPQMIGEIQKDFCEKKIESGAFYCTVPGFRDTYRVISRGMERNGQSAFLLVCTLVDRQGRPMEHSTRLNAMANELCVAIKSSLRRCDVFTKYNQAQFLVMLFGIKEENCQIVIRRITNAFTKEHKSWASHLECSVSSFYNMESERRTTQTSADKIMESLK